MYENRSSLECAHSTPGHRAHNWCQGPAQPTFYIATRRLNVSTGPGEGELRAKRAGRRRVAAFSNRSLRCSSS